MEFDLSCECGHEISAFTRSNSLDASVQIECDECSAVYAVTVSQLRTGE